MFINPNYLLPFSVVLGVKLLGIAKFKICRTGKKFGYKSCDFGRTTYQYPYKNHYHCALNINNADFPFFLPASVLKIT